MRRTIITLAILLFSAQFVFAEMTVEYNVTVSKPQTHIFEVRVDVANIDQDYIDLSIPVWSTGMYVVQDFAANVMQFHAHGADGAELAVSRPDENTWRVDLAGGNAVTVTYEMFAQTPHSTYSFLNDTAGHLLCNSVVAYIEGAIDLPSKLTLSIPKGWEAASSAVPDAEGALSYSMPNYHVLADSIFLMGRLERRGFEVDGVAHEVAFVGRNDMDIDVYTADCRKFVEAARALMGPFPYKKYSFLLYFGDHHGGGLEHLSGTTMVSGRWGFTSPRGHKSMVNLACHEYFHLWNVKRIKPEEFDPYKYDRANTTGFLWFSEGVTEYYTNQLMLRAGHITSRDSLDNLQNLINEFVNNPSRGEKSVYDASLDAYVSGKMARGNSINTFYSYYPRGEIAGNILDLEIISRTGGEKSFDDVLLLMWEGTQKGESYTTEEVRALCEQVAGGSFKEVFDDYVTGTAAVPFDEYLAKAGLELVADEGATAAKNAGGYLGIRCWEMDGALTVSSVSRGTQAWLAGLSGGDEILAIDGVRIKSRRDYDLQLSSRKPGDEIEMLIGREGLVVSQKVALEEYPNPVYVIRENPDASELQKKIFSKWQERR